MNETVNRPVRGRVLIAYLVLSFVIALVASGFATDMFWPTLEDELPDPMEDALLGLLWYALLLPMVLYALSGSGVRIGSLLVPSSRPVGVVWAFFMAVALIAFSIGTVFLTFLPLSYAAPDLVDTLLLDGPLLWTPGDEHTTANIINLFGIVLLGPVTEEVLFRGGLFRLWSDRWGVRKAAVISSLLFGVLHVDVIGGFVFGYVMAMVFRRTGSLWLPIAIHIANNGIVTLLEVLITEDEYTIDQFRSEWWMGLVGLVVGIPLLIFLYRRMDRASTGESGA